MRQGFQATNHLDENGMPTGGSVAGKGFSIAWQNGPLGRGVERLQPNGAFVEDVIAACLQRIRFFQDGRFHCRENALAITKLEEALMWLESRTRDREEREVEGTHGV